MDRTPVNVPQNVSIIKRGLAQDVALPAGPQRSPCVHHHRRAAALVSYTQIFVCHPGTYATQGLWG